jgi:hypothetical protein
LQRTELLKRIALLINAPDNDRPGHVKAARRSFIELFYRHARRSLVNCLMHGRHRYYLSFQGKTKSSRISLMLE